MPKLSYDEVLKTGIQALVHVWGFMCVGSCVGVHVVGVIWGFPNGLPSCVMALIKEDDAVHKITKL